MDESVDFGIRPGVSGYRVAAIYPEVAASVESGRPIT